MTSNYPQAIQAYIRVGVVRRFATCSTHDKQSSEFRGIQWNLDLRHDYWAFHCKSKGGHIFLALPDKSAPKTTEEAVEWQAKQEAESVGSYDSGGRSIPHNPDGSLRAGR